jgi:ethanolamine ammonia-lyase small subunit
LNRKDPWARYRAVTRARIGLGRSGDALPTTAQLAFQLAHACARDAVQAAVNFAQIEAQLAPLPVLHVRSRVSTRDEYLRRPDLGRRLTDDSRRLLGAAAEDDDWDVLFVIADGLSAAAIVAHAASVLAGCLERLPGWRIAPIVCAEQARVAIGDEIGQIMKARLCVLLIGERPGLSVADSLGVYLTWNPHIGVVDSERNCVSSIHANGLGYARASDTTVWLIKQAFLRQLTGVGLKEAALPVAEIYRTQVLIN